MCGPGDDIKDIKEEAGVMGEREGIMERRSSMNGDRAKFLMWMVGALYAIQMTWMGWMSITILGIDAKFDAIDKRVAIIESNRFDAAEGTEVWKNLTRLEGKVNQNGKDLIRLETKVSTHHP